MRSKHLLGIKYLAASEIEEVLELAEICRRQIDAREQGHALSGKTVVTLFYESSTRTKNSFETAARNLGAKTTSITAGASSVTKGESLIDTGKTLDSLMTDFIVIRHPMSGAPHLLSANVNASVINAGDGMDEHPTQALLDLFTMKRHFGDIKGLKVVIVGDIKHSRVARSNLWALTKMGASVTLVAPGTLLPAGKSELGCHMTTSLAEAAHGADVIMGLRLQLERQKSALFPSIAEYSGFYKISGELAEKSGALIMHPGPINRGVEIDGEVADGASSAILQQVTNGVAVRMAIFKLLVR